MKPPPPHAPWDPGLQPERTALAWNRTALAAAVGALVLARLLTHHHPVAATVAFLTVPPCALALLALTARRARRTDHRLRTGAPLRPGALPAALTAAVCLVGVQALIWIILN
ncbi:DUF202 domain-containing protein [Streptomyces sp. NPDC048659]|uniref:DUF202 domain-containing protein n=1 Tax=Streptomyces sp. NPDC048659 TaxID=3155489 RepID=UPI003443EF71